MPIDPGLIKLRILLSHLLEFFLPFLHLRSKWTFFRGLGNDRFQSIHEVPSGFCEVCDRMKQRIIMLCQFFLRSAKLLKLWLQGGDDSVRIEPMLSEPVAEIPYVLQKRR